jgi:hypothetical protein
VNVILHFMILILLMFDLFVHDSNKYFSGPKKIKIILEGITWYLLRKSQMSSTKSQVVRQGSSSCLRLLSDSPQNRFYLVFWVTFYNEISHFLLRISLFFGVVQETGVEVQLLGIGLVSLCWALLLNLKVTASWI